MTFRDKDRYKLYLEIMRGGERMNFSYFNSVIASAEIIKYITAWEMDRSFACFSEFIIEDCEDRAQKMYDKKEFDSAKEELRTLGEIAKKAITLE